MSGIKITRFLGTAPKISPELLPDTAAQIARNCKLYSGDLIPYPRVPVVASTQRTGLIRTLYALRNPDDSYAWLSWATNVSIAIASEQDTGDQRFYYTGDGAPKVSNYKLATTGTPPFPVGSYDLGLPLPTDDDKLVTTARAITSNTSTASASRSSNVATINTSAPHLLATGAFVTISGFTSLSGTYTDNTTTLTVTINGHGLTTGAIVPLNFTSGAAVDGDYTVNVTGPNTFTVTSTGGITSGNVELTLTSFNVPNVQVTVVDADTFTYPNAGFNINTVTVTNGVVAAAGTTTQSFARDAGNTATVVTSGAHNLRTGNVVSISGFPAATPTVATFNATNVEVTVVDPTTITYFSPGEQRTTTLNSDGTVTLSGLTQARSYVFTWYTPWDEESVASPPSENLFIKEGVTVEVTNLPTTKPAGNNFVRGVRLYRTLPSATGTEYFRLATLWFPTDVAFIERTAGVVGIETTQPHNLGIGDRFKLTGTSGVDVTDGIVTDVLDEFAFEFALAGGDIALMPSAGTLYVDYAETLDDPARYFGDGGDYDFVDDFDSRNLLDTLETDEFDPPPENLQGLTAIQNGIICGFVDNQIYFCELDRPHAWPRRYVETIEHNIVAMAAVSGSLLVLTDSYPYLVSGSDPAAGMAVQRIDVKYPCLNPKSVVTMGYGIVYATHDGLAVYSPSAGPNLITRVLHSSDTWNQSLDPSTLVAEYYGDAYFASHSAGAIVFERDDRVGGFFVDVDTTFTASWYDTRTNRLFIVRGDDGDISEWDVLSQPNDEMEWKSKVIVTKDFVNIGAARVIADYAALSPLWEDVDTDWEDTELFWDGAVPVTFTMWADKEQIFQIQLTDSGVFRLPTGYRTDTFEVSVEGTVRIRSIHLGETPTSLRTA